MGLAKKNTIEVKHSDKDFYRVMKELQLYKRSEFSFPDEPKRQRGLARKIGIHGKPLIDAKLLNPPTITHNRYPSLNVVSIPIPKPPRIKKIEIRERKGNKTSWFDFY